MTLYNRGDVVLIGFVFADETGAKQRPAVIISSDTYHQQRQEAIISAITSKTDRILVADCLISDWQEAGLLFPSVATGIIRTIKQGMITHRLGTMSQSDLKEVNKQLSIALGQGGKPDLYNFTMHPTALDFETGNVKAPPDDVYPLPGKP